MREAPGVVARSKRGARRAIRVPKSTGGARRGVTWLALSVVMILALAACGGDDRAVIVYDGPPDTGTAIGAGLGAATTTTTPGPKLGPWVDVTGNLAGMPSECGNTSYVAGRPGTDQVFAGIALQGLWLLDPTSAQWTKQGGLSPTQIKNRTLSLIFDPGNPNQYWESGSYTAPGVVHTTDGGATFQGLGGLGAIDGLSIDLKDPAHKTMLAGSHERGDLWRSTDAGATWTQVAPTLPSGVFASQPLVLDSQNFLLGTHAQNGKGAGIFRSADGGATWKQITTTGIDGLPLVAKDGNIYWPLQDKAGIARSTDNGLSFTSVARTVGVQSYTVLEMADGRLASIGGSNVIVSADKGLTWKVIGPMLPMTTPTGLAYSAARNSLYVWRWDCPKDGAVVVPPKSIESLSLVPVPG